MIFSNKSEIGLKDVRKENKVTNKALLEYLENIASKHSDSVGLGANDIMKTRLTWVILEWKLEVINRPKYGECLNIGTWARYSQKCYSYRDFEIYDSNGNKCANATSKWLLINIDRGRPVRIEESLMSKYEPEYDKSVFNITELEKLKELDSYDLEKKINIRRSDIDINGHVHNLNYLDYAYEILPKEECEKEFDNVRITYKKEIKYGDNVKCLYRKENNKNCISIENTENSIVHAIIELY